MTCTWCYVCGGQSILAEDCVDEYPLTMREDNKQNCDEVLGHTVGCVKSKYVDLDGKQIGQFFFLYCLHIITVNIFHVETGKQIIYGKVMLRLLTAF